LVVLRRLDCVLEPTKAKVLETAARLEGKVANVDPILCQVAGEQFYNTSPLDLRRLLDDPTRIADNLLAYIARFSPAARDVLDKFDFRTQVDRLDRADVLYLVVSRFCEIDLHPDVVSNLEMGYLYEELIRRFSELSNETAGEHFTPREVIRLMVNLLFIEDDRLLARPGVIKTLFDPACGTGGMLSVAEDHLRSLNPQARLEVFGQELNAETYAVCRSDMMLKGQDVSHIVWGNSFSEASDNQIVIVGNLVDDPELRFTSNGTPVANLRVAVTPRVLEGGTWRDGQTSFFRVNAWRENVTHLAESLHKGDRVVVLGRLRQRSWETPEGERRSAAEIEADEVAASLRWATAKIERVTTGGAGESTMFGSPES
jgi:single stranded DNA-binding protein